MGAVYLEIVREFIESWRVQLANAGALRADAATYAIIDIPPAHPIITTPLATVATGRARSAIHMAVSELEAAGVLLPLSQSKWNRSWKQPVSWISWRAWRLVNYRWKWVRGCR